MEKSLKSLVQKLQQNDNGTLQGGFGSIRGGFDTDPITPANEVGCSNPGDCTKQNSRNCSNSGTCSGDNGSGCSNTGQCL